MEIDRELFVANLGGAAQVALMNSEAKADALEDFMMERLNETAPGNGTSGDSSGRPPAGASSGKTWFLWPPTGRRIASS